VRACLQERSELLGTQKAELDVLLERRSGAEADFMEQYLAACEQVGGHGGWVLKRSGDTWVNGRPNDSGGSGKEARAEGMVQPGDKTFARVIGRAGCLSVAA